MKRFLNKAFISFAAKKFSTLRGPVIGINFGATNSSVAILEDRKAKVLTNAEGSRTTPSVVAFNKDGECLVGASALRQAVLNSQNTIYGIKSLLGQRYDDENVQKIIKDFPYKIVNSSNGDVLVEAQGQIYSPSQIAAFILTRLKQPAENYLKKQVHNAVISVPSYFNDLQRQELKQACNIAGLNVLRIFNEASAAAFSYYLEDKRIAVFNLGGGTFDFSILKRSKDRIYEVISNSDDTFLGGNDFDNVIVHHLVSEFQRENGIDLTKDLLTMKIVREAAEKAKCDLSSSAQTEIILPNIANSIIGGTKNISIKLSCSKFEELTDDLFKIIEKTCKKVMEDAELEPSDIEEVLLVGEMSKMSKIRETVENIFGKKPYDIKNNSAVVKVKDETILFENKKMVAKDELLLSGIIYLGVLSGDINYLNGNRSITSNYIKKASINLFNSERKWDREMLFDTALIIIKGFYLDLNIDIIYTKSNDPSSFDISANMVRDLALFATHFEKKKENFSFSTFIFEIFKRHDYYGCPYCEVDEDLCNDVAEFTKKFPKINKNPVKKVLMQYVLGIKKPPKKYKDCDEWPDRTFTGITFKKINKNIRKLFKRQLYIFKNKQQIYRKNSKKLVLFQAHVKDIFNQKKKKKKKKF